MITRVCCFRIVSAQTIRGDEGGTEFVLTSKQYDGQEAKGGRRESTGPGRRTGRRRGKEREKEEIGLTSFSDPSPTS